MKRFLLLILLTLQCTPSVLNSSELVYEGILGNSGAHGESLVRFSTTLSQGIGVVQDKYGTFWGKAGKGVLNRYTLDGRLIAAYPITSDEAAGDRITQVEDYIALLLGGKIYTLPIDAKSGQKSKCLKTVADFISVGSFNKQIAIYRKKNIYKLNILNESSELVAKDLPADVTELEMTPSGEIIAAYNGKFFSYKNGREVPEENKMAGCRMLFLNGYWYSFNWHGTIIRFNADFQPAPGVILGGASGSFIGRVDQNNEISLGNGMASAGDNLFVVGGINGILHLLYWNESRSQMEIIRRIGALPECHGLAMNRQGDVWVNGGMWKWSDSPETAQSNGISLKEMGPAVLLANNTFVSIALSHIPVVLWGNYTVTSKVADATELNQEMIHGAALYRSGENTHVLVIDAHGKGRAISISQSGEFKTIGQSIELIPSPPIHEWTSLTMKGDQSLLGAGDGNIVEMEEKDGGWKEIHRWNSWGSQPDQHFGKEIYLYANGNNLWVSDTQRHRVLCFSIKSGQPLACYGVCDESGSDQGRLSEPKVLVENENRVVVYDSQNQRLVKLVLKD
jgi:hypothetical protein